MKFFLEPFYERVEKPWGYEVVLTPKDSERTGKILHVAAGKRLSFQYHETKEEVITLFSGRAVIWLEDDAGEIRKIPMEPKKGYLVKPPQKHRVEALEDSDIFEVSSPEKGTTYRLEDDFTRPDETESLRQQKNRGWN
ncbi:MAG: cupin [Patescibacteria group bacterium]|nr:cupin [Patescibacteria group bacterium]